MAYTMIYTDLKLVLTKLITQDLLTVSDFFSRSKKKDKDLPLSTQCLKAS